MVAISFSKVGELTQDRNRRRERERSVKLPLGIMTPVRAGDDAEGIFKMHTDLAPLIRDNLRNLLLTNHGDRVIDYGFGANLQPLTFELTGGEDFELEAMQRIKQAVDKYMPFVTLIDFEANVNHSNEQLPVGIVDIKVRYDVRRAGIKNESVTVRFFVGG